MLEPADGVAVKVHCLPFLTSLIENVTVLDFPAGTTMVVESPVLDEILTFRATLLLLVTVTGTE